LLHFCHQFIIALLPYCQLIVAFMPSIDFCAASLLAVDCCFMLPVYFPLFSAGSLLPSCIAGLMKAQTQTGYTCKFAVAFLPSPWLINNL